MTHHDLMLSVEEVARIAAARSGGVSFLHPSSCYAFDSPRVKNRLLKPLVFIEQGRGPLPNATIMSSRAVLDIWKLGSG